MSSQRQALSMRNKEKGRVVDRLSETDCVTSDFLKYLFMVLSLDSFHI